MVLDQSLLSLLLSAVLEAILEARTFMTPWNQCNCMPTMLYKQMPCIFTCKRGQLGRGMHCASLGAMHNACIPAVSIDTVSILDWELMRLQGSGSPQASSHWQSRGKKGRL